MPLQSEGPESKTKVPALVRRSNECAQPPACSCDSTTVTRRPAAQTRGGACVCSSGCKAVPPAARPSDASGELRTAPAPGRPAGSILGERGGSHAGLQSARVGGTLCEARAQAVPRQQARTGEAADARTDDDDVLLLPTHGGLCSRGWALAGAQPRALEAKGGTEQKRGRRHVSWKLSEGGLTHQSARMPLLDYDARSSNV